MIRDDLRVLRTRLHYLASLYFVFVLVILTRLSVRLTVTAVALLRVCFDALYCRLCRIFSKYRCRFVTCNSCTRISSCPLCETQRETSILSSFVVASSLRPRFRLVVSIPSAPFEKGRVVAVHSRINRMSLACRVR